MSSAARYPRACLLFQLARNDWSIACGWAANGVYLALHMSGFQSRHAKRPLTGKCELVRDVRTGLLPELK